MALTLTLFKHAYFQALGEAACLASLSAPFSDFTLIWCWTAVFNVTCMKKQKMLISTNVQINSWGIYILYTLSYLSTTHTSFCYSSFFMSYTPTIPILIQGCVTVILLHSLESYRNNVRSSWRSQKQQCERFSKLYTFLVFCDKIASFFWRSNQKF